MSATNRGSERDPLDRYDTPAWPVHRLLERVHLPLEGRWLEPCAGNGSIRAAVESWRPDMGKAIEWTEVDIAPRREGITKADFFEWIWKQPIRPGLFDVTPSNPPYQFALKFAFWSTRVSKVTALLLRLNWLEGAATEEPARFEFLRETKPDLYILPNRPEFRLDGKPLVRKGKEVKGSDATAYAWYVWHPDCDGRYRHLDATPKAERRPA
jgi:hypothetical protein